MLTGFNIYERSQASMTQKEISQDYIFLRRGRDLTGAVLDYGQSAEGRLRGRSNFRAHGFMVHGFRAHRSIAAQLQGAMPPSAQLQGANLIDAQLQGARLVGRSATGRVVVQGHNFKAQNLIAAQLQGANPRRRAAAGASLMIAVASGRVSGRRSAAGREAG